MPPCTSWKKSLSPVTIATSKPAVDRLGRQRADHVVRLVALGGDDRYAERFAGLVDPRNLLGEIGRHRRAIGLVVGDQVVAEGAAGEIERGADVLRLMILNQLPQHVHEDVDRVRRLAAGAAQAAAAHRVIRAVHLRAAVDQEYAAAWTSCGRERKNREKKQYIIAEWSQRLTRDRQAASRAKRWLVFAGILLAVVILWWRSGDVRDVFGRQYQDRGGPHARTRRRRHADHQCFAPALAALRGLDVDPAAPSVDRDRIRALYESRRHAGHVGAAPVAPPRPPVRPDQSRVRRRAEVERGGAVVVVALRAHAGERPAPVPADRRRLSAEAGHAQERRLGRRRDRRVPRCTCPAASSSTTRAISRRTSRPASIAATSSPGSSTSPIASTAVRWRSKCAWTASRSSIARCSCSRAPSPPQC